jgi:hypothetical protein
LGKRRNEKSISNQIETVNLTLTLDLRKKRVGEMRSYQGTYLTAHHHCRRYLDACVETEPEPSLDAAASAGGHGPKGTIAKPLDGGALSLAGNALAGEGTRSGASTLSSRHGRFSGSCYGKAREKGGVREKEGREEPASAACRAVLLAVVGTAGHGRRPLWPPALWISPVGKEAKEKGWEMIGEEEMADGLSRAALDLAVAGGHVSHGRSSTAACVRKTQGRKRKGTRVTRKSSAPAFCSCEACGRPSDADRQ